MKIIFRNPNSSTFFKEFDLDKEFNLAEEFNNTGDAIDHLRAQYNLEGWLVSKVFNS